MILIGILYYAGGLLVWPLFCLFRRGVDARKDRLRKIFALTFGALVAVLLTMVLISEVSQSSENWLVVTLLFPVVNLASVVLSLMAIFAKYGHVS